MPATTRRVTVADFGKDATEIPVFTVNALPAAEREHANRAADAARTLFVKALLHRLSPGEYAVSSDTSSLEAQAVKAVSELDATTFNRLRPRLQSLHADRTVLIGYLGARAAGIDLRRPIGDAGTGMMPLIKLGKQPPAAKPPPPKWGRVFLNLRKLHCMDETNPEGGADDMVLGGLLIGPAGGAKAIKSFVAGAFDDGDVQDYGSYPLGSVSLTVSPGYPKNVYCIVMLVESDQDDQGAANALSHVCNLVAAFATAMGQGVAAAAFAAASGIIGVLASLIDDDVFPPYGIELRLGSALEFGGDGVDINRRTGGIQAHGGTYRVGFRWELVA